MRATGRCRRGPAAAAALLGPAEIRALAAQLGLRPTKTLGQNFVIDANTVRRIVRVSGVGADDVGPRGRPRAGVADARPARDGPARGGRRGRPGAGRAAAGDGGRACPGARRPAHRRRRRRAADHRPAGRARPPWSPTCPTTSACPVLLHLLATFPTHRARAGDGAAGGRRAARRAARLARVRRAVGEGALVRRRPSGRAGRARRCSGRCRTWTPGSSSSSGRPRPATTSSAPRCSR